MNAKCHEVMLMVKLSVISVTWHTFQNRVSDTIMHVKLNTRNGAPTSCKVHKVKKLEVKLGGKFITNHIDTN